jgi:hypothetical protein
MEKRIYVCVLCCRIGKLSPDYVAREIVKGVLEERESISVPRFMLLWICFLRLVTLHALKD